MINEKEKEEIKNVDAFAFIQAIHFAQEKKRLEVAELEDRLLGSLSYLHFFRSELSGREIEGLESDINSLLAQLIAL